LLEDRSRRDELGDCFVAWHQPLHRRVQLQILPEKITRQSPEFAAVSNSVESSRRTIWVRMAGACLSSTK
jgi:hypothetical protein